jgi:hypothetical protein
MCQHGRGWRIDRARINSIPEWLLSQRSLEEQNAEQTMIAASFGKIATILRLSEPIPSHIGRIPHERNLDLMRC